MASSESSAIGGPALGLVEVASVARGMVVADAVVKKAAVKLLASHPVTPGKYLVVVCGKVEEVHQALSAGLEKAQDTLVDHLFLAKIDPQIVPAMDGTIRANPTQSLGIVETFSVAAAVLAADRSLKEAEVVLVQMRLARGLGGRAFYVVAGELHQVEAAVAAGRTIIHDGMLFCSEIIANPDQGFLELLYNP